MHVKMHAITAKAINLHAVGQCHLCTFLQCCNSLYKVTVNSAVPPHMYTYYPDSRPDEEVATLGGEGGVG